MRASGVISIHIIRVTYQECRVHVVIGHRRCRRHRLHFVCRPDRRRSVQQGHHADYDCGAGGRGDRILAGVAPSDDAELRRAGRNDGLVDGNDGGERRQWLQGRCGGHERSERGGTAAGRTEEQAEVRAEAVQVHDSAYAGVFPRVSDQSGFGEY